MVDTPRKIELPLRRRDVFGTSANGRRGIGLEFDRYPAPAAQSAMPNEFTITAFRSERRPHGRGISLTWSALARRLTEHEPSSEKYGSCWSPFSFEGDQRSSENSVSASVMALDYDHGVEIGIVLDKLKALNLAAIIATTHSHTLDAPRFRVVVPLDRPWRASNYANQETAARIWKAGVDRLAEALGALSDQNAKDAARVFFDPRRPVAGPEPVAHILSGNPVNTDWLFAPDAQNRRPPRALPRHAVASGEPVFADMGELRLAMLAIQNDQRFDRGTWIKVLGAIKHEAGLHDAEDEGLEIAKEWSAEWEGERPQDAKSDDEETEAAWDSLKSDRMNPATGATIIKFARSDGWLRPGPYFVMEDERQKADRARPVRAAKKLTFYQPGELAALSDASYLVKGWMFKEQLSILYGQPGSGKTFLALDMAFHIALGLPWFGKKLERGVVVYIALEGIGGIRRRAKAWCKHHRVDLLSVPIVFASGMMDLRSDKQAPVWIAEAGRKECKRYGLELKLVVIDTLARAAGGADENAAKDMGEAVAAADAIRETTGAHVCLVHHAGKDDNRGMRGSSALSGAADTVIRVATDKRNGQKVAEIEKQKDDESGQPIAFTLEGVELGEVDDDGDQIRSAVIVPTDKFDFKDEQQDRPERDGLRGLNRSAMEILRRLATETTSTRGGQARIPKRDWQKALRSDGWGPSDDKSFVQAFRRACTSILKTKSVVGDGEFVLVTGTPIDRFPDYAS